MYGSEFYDVINGKNRFSISSEHYYDVTHIHLDRYRKYVLFLNADNPQKTLYIEVDTIHPDAGAYDPDYYGWNN